MNAHPCISKSATLRRREGFHMRLARDVVNVVQAFPGDVFIRLGPKSADAKSIFEMLTLIALPNSVLEVEGRGDGAEAIVDAIVELISRPNDDPA